MSAQAGIQRRRRRETPAFAAAVTALAVTLALAAPAPAQEPSGCASFKWPLDHERAALLANKQTTVNGGALAYDAAVTLKLAPIAEAGLPHDPERAPKTPNSYAGHFTLPAPPRAGPHKVTISSEGWIDVLDNGAFVHPKAFSGARDCEGARKSVQFALPAAGVTLQLSGVKDPEIGLIVTPAK